MKISFPTGIALFAALGFLSAAVAPAPARAEARSDGSHFEMRRFETAERLVSAAIAALAAEDEGPGDDRYSLALRLGLRLGAILHEDGVDPARARAVAGDLARLLATPGSERLRSEFTPDERTVMVERLATLLGGMP